MVDTTAPSVVSVAVPSNATYGLGQNLTFTVTWSEPVNVDVTNGTPRIALTLGNSPVYAVYVSGSGNAALVFKYTVQAGDADADGISMGGRVEGNDGTITDAAGNVAERNLIGRGSIGAVLIQGTPTVVAHADVDQTVVSRAIVTLNATASVGTNLTYLWSQTSGPTMQLSRTTAAQPTFTAPTVDAGDPDAILIFSLVVNDGFTSSAADTITVTVQSLTTTPAVAFETAQQEIRQTLTDDATRGLKSTLSANQSMVQAAKGRFVAGADQTIPLDVEGSFSATPISLSTMGTFFGQSTGGDGARRLVFGTFDVQRDDDSGASTATFNGKIAWERSVSDRTLLGYFIGGDVAQSNIAGSFTGDQAHLGLSAGGYAVHEMADRLYLDGFVSLGVGRNNLTMSDNVLDLDSDYTTRSASFGLAISGVIEAKRYEIWPELALTVGRTWLNTVAFTGTADGVTDDNLSLDAGAVTQANLTFRPEFRLPLDRLAAGQSHYLLTFAPRLICEKSNSTTTACGTGAEIGLQTHSPDGLTTATVRILSDWVDGQTTTSGQLNFEHRF